MYFVCQEGFKIAMEITGSQQVKAPRQRVFEALLAPQILKECIPGCESAEYVDDPDGRSGRELKLIISPNVPGLKGPYTLYVRTGEVVAPSRLVLISEPYNALGRIRATCTITLSEDAGAAEATNLTYAAEAVLEGKIAATPEVVIKNTLKLALEQFFKNFEKQLGAITA
jgi:carbon monoxide dehydrogenase subunit G